MFYVYILLLSNNTLYTGFTSNLKARVSQHEKGRVISTKHKRPVKLIHYEAYTMRSDALRRERFLKTTEGKRILKLQLRDLLAKLYYPRRGARVDEWGGLENR